MRTPHPQPSPDGPGRPGPLRILAADADPAVCRLYREALTGLGHEVLIGDGQPLAAICRAARPDLLIADAVPADRPGPADGTGHLTPVVLAADGSVPDHALLSPHFPVVALLSRPPRPDALRAAVAAAVRTADRLRALQAEVADLRQQLEDRKVLERAKGAVMRYCALPEADAYDRLRALASRRNQKLVDVGHAVLAAAEVFRKVEDPRG